MFNRRKPGQHYYFKCEAHRLLIMYHFTRTKTLLLIMTIPTENIKSLQLIPHQKVPNDPSQLTPIQKSDQTPLNRNYITIIYCHILIMSYIFPGQRQ